MILFLLFHKRKKNSKKQTPSEHNEVVRCAPNAQRDRNKFENKKKERSRVANKKTLRVPAAFLPRLTKLGLLNYFILDLFFLYILDFLPPSPPKVFWGGGSVLFFVRQKQRIKNYIFINCKNIIIKKIQRIKEKKKQKTKTKEKKT